jgi:hypothetical protein
MPKLNVGRRSVPLPLHPCSIPLESEGFIFQVGVGLLPRVRAEKTLRQAGFAFSAFASH